MCPEYYYGVPPKKYGPPVSQGQNKSGSSSSGMGTIIVIAAAAALVTKFLGIW